VAGTNRILLPLPPTSAARPDREAAAGVLATLRASVLLFEISVAAVTAGSLLSLPAAGFHHNFSSILRNLRRREKT
jgi:hypothetical protein